ncbi:MAG: FAD-dependent oxidoreductase [Lachnospiraceae bacterium]|jgi:2,4-dienoyl-CoA reductase (NADPH2)|nr:FAD-dependent oxidoreductase [Lachnospiraceae bacterium]
MATSLERLFSPFQVKGLALKNRVVMPALHHLYTPEGYATDRFNEYYYTRAEGGAGLIVVGGCCFDELGRSGSMMSLATDDTIPGWAQFTKGMHDRGAKVAVQLYHAGRYAKESNLPEGEKAVSASAVFSKYSRATPREMGKDDIRRTVERWATGAVRAQKAGFDAVEIIASAGYLICQFLSPTTNLRTDEYGGSWENRCRFPLEVIAAVRAAVGPDYPLFMRISGNDFVKGSNTNEEAVEFAKLIEKAGIDLINVTGGWHESRVPQITGELPRGGYTYLAAGVKAAVSVPVVASNRLGDPVSAELTLALGRADLINVGRPLIADPEWPNKAREGRLDEIRRCVACNQGCLSKTFFGKPIECLVNGSCGREYLLKGRPAKAAAPKNILTVGAGPAGCEFAIRAAALGHHVTLWEKTDRVGGQLGIVSAPPGKEEFACIAPYFRTMLGKSGVDLVFGKEADAQSVVAGGYDAVVVATGSAPKQLRLAVPDDGSVPVVSAHDVLAEKCIPGKRVLIVGGGSVGCETAIYLARKGGVSPEQLYFMMANRSEKQEKIVDMLDRSDYDVTILEVLERIGGGFEPGTAGFLIADMRRLGVKDICSCEIKGIKGGVVSVAAKTADGAVLHEIPCDTIVTAVGSASVDDLYAQLEGKVPAVYSIGDAKEVGKILDGIRAADDLADAI